MYNSCRKRKSSFDILSWSHVSNTIRDNVGIYYLENLIEIMQNLRSKRRSHSRKNKFNLNSYMYLYLINYEWLILSI